MQVSMANPGSGVATQPRDGSQVSVAHGSPSSQAIGVPEQVPVAGSHVPAVWHWSDAVQTTGFVPTQVPAWQESLWVQASPSVQAVPSSRTGFEHTPLVGSQMPAPWH